MRGLGLLVVAFVLFAAREASASVDVQFGGVDVGSSEVRYLNVTSASLGTTTITAGSIVNDPNHWFTFAVPQCDGVASCSHTWTLDSSTTVIPFRCSPPANATGVATAQVQFTNATVMPTLVCSANTALIAITPGNSVVDFGAVDLDTPGTPTSTITLKNIGSAAVTLSAGTFTPTTGPVFTVSPLPMTPLPIGASVSFTVTYAPTTERTTDAPDLAAISWIVVGPTQTQDVEITLRGHGVDRHASLKSVATVPDTFVKPGARATLVDIVVANTGGAPLGLTGPKITNGPVWTIANAEAVDVPGYGTFTYRVRFAPTDTAASSATFSVATTDPAMPMLTATLAGAGKLRDVMMGPAVIDMQYVAIGTTATVSEGTRGAPLVVTNLDTTHAFQIHVLYALSNEFEVLDGHDVELGAGATVSFDVAFTPKHAGMFDANAILLLDDDPDPAATIELHGEGVAVETQGGGGCSTTGNASGGLAILIAILSLRKRRAAIIVLATAATAHADTRNIDLSLFDPTPSTTPTWFQVQTADAGRDGDWALAALASYANDPLVLHTAPNDNVAIQNRMMFELGGAFAFGDRFEAGARFPLYVQSGENLNSPTMFGEPSAAGAAAGNIAVNAKARLWHARTPEHDLAIGTAATLALPTETDGQFAGSGRPQLDVLGLITFATGPLMIAAQVGVVVRANASFHDLDQGNGMLWGASGSYHLQPRLAVEAELFGEAIPGDAIEALVGARYQVERRFNVALGLGRGVTSAPGAPAVRGVVGLTFTPNADKSFGVVGHRSVGDADHDGVPDDVDKCPNQAEDKDGFEDEDGCPDPDNDGDGIPDAQDKCPNLAEDKDGFEDEDGCPDIDNDHDGILDRFDRCPNQAETINGIDDDDGCPDPGAGLVTIDKNAITLGESVTVIAGKVASTSFNVLGQLGATLRAHTELIKIRVKGSLAQPVIDWLIQYGIASERLEPQAGATDLEITIVDRY